MFIYEPEEFEKKRSAYVEKMKNKMAEIHKLAEEKRAVVVAKKREDQLKSAVKEAQTTAAYGVVAATSDSSFSENDDVMPYSLSQIDISVLHQLPEEMRADILELLPAHRKQECNSNLGPAKSSPQQSSDTNYTEDLSGPRESISINDFWLGNPPIWVEDFKKSSCLVLSVFADSYYKSGSTGQLSSILQRAMSDFVPSVGSTPDGLDNVEKINEKLSVGDAVGDLLSDGKSHCPTLLLGRCAKPSNASSSNAPTDTYVQELTTKIRQSLADEVEEKVKQVQAEVDVQIVNYDLVIWLVDCDGGFCIGGGVGW
ncbi:hypothetical protein POM88_048807 [Heracleum sosnowskyi]|uniref:Remorin C-terminal domain-containing protein n=1 Tax=Heracleum sosnowskyi TaxID=360622 RepID=A0AAD8GVW1_9APIA|nr:hypothetical protein POM88_048807 [Heracleum sosnowskyi]